MKHITHVNVIPKPQDIILSPVKKEIDRIIESYATNFLLEQKPHVIPDDKWPAGKPTKWKEKNKEAVERALKAMGAVAYNVGSLAGGLSATAIYYLTVAKDIFKFETNGEAKTMNSGLDPITKKPKNAVTRYYYKLDTNQSSIGIYSDSDKDEKDRRLTLKPTSSGGASIELPSDQAERVKRLTGSPKSDEWSTKDTIRFTLDAIGWIPFYGEVADFINACWYFYDYTKSKSYWDLAFGWLSLLGCIPVLGTLFTAGKQGMKASLKAYKIAAQSSPNLLVTILERFKIMKPEIFSPSNLSTMITGYRHTIKGFAAVSKKLRENIDSVEFDKTLKDIEDMFMDGEQWLLLQQQNAKKALKQKGAQIEPKYISAADLATLDGHQVRIIKPRPGTFNPSYVDPTTGNTVVDATGERFWKIRYFDNGTELDYLDYKSMLKPPKNPLKAAVDISSGEMTSYFKRLNSLTYEKQISSITQKLERIVDATAAKSAGIISKAGIPVGGASNKVVDFLKNSLVWAMKTHKQKFIVNKMNRIFMNSVTNDSTKMATMLFTSNSVNKRKILDLLESAYDSSTRLTNKNIINPSKPLKAGNLDINGLTKLIKSYITKNPGGASSEFYNSMKTLIDDAMDASHPLYTEFIANPWNSLKSYPPGLAELSSILKQWYGAGSGFINLLVKQVFAESRELAFKMGWTDEGTARGVLVKMISKAHPEWFKVIKDEKEDLMTPATTNDNPYVIDTTAIAPASSTGVVAPTTPRPRRGSLSLFNR